MLANYQRLLTNFGALITWFAVLAQLVLIIENRFDSVPETLLRFFSYFTILTNLLVALYFTAMLFQNSWLYRFFSRAGHFTALVVYISLVSIIYQIFLRPIWNPEGVQIIVDELLHTLIPIFVVLYWFLFADKKTLEWKQIPNWFLYLACYAIYILVRGAITGVYPYPFIDVAHLGYPPALMNTLGIFVLFGGLSVTFMFIAKRF
jgi:hypothetical protein